jgi:predicted enzyme related to lactoylglutathione lyase
VSIRVKEVAFVAHAVSDIERARGFYEGWLGLKPAMQVEFAPGKWWIEYEIGGVALALSNASPDTWRRSSSLALEVVDLDGALADAKASGIRVSVEPMEFAPCRMFIVKDPDDNEVTLHQRKA